MNTLVLVIWKTFQGDINLSVLHLCASVFTFSRILSVSLYNMNVGKVWLQAFPHADSALGHLKSMAL